jgi:hypothetical protein
LLNHALTTAQFWGAAAGGVPCDTDTVCHKDFPASPIFRDPEMSRHDIASPSDDVFYSTQGTVKFGLVVLTRLLPRPNYFGVLALMKKKGEKRVLYVAIRHWSVGESWLSSE